MTYELTVAPEATIRAVLFDFGGVFVSSPFAFVAQTAAEHGVDVVAFSEWLFGAYDRDEDHPWHRLERGELAFDDAMSQIAAMPDGVGGSPLDVLAGMAASELYEFMTEFAHDVHEANLATAVVTNNIAEFGAHWQERVPMELFDAVIDSSAVGVRKPNPAIYRLALDAVGVEADEAVFIDDAPGNIAAASALGIHTLWVPFERAGVEAGVAALRQRLGV